MKTNRIDRTGPIDRRGFIKSSGAVAAGLASLPTLTGAQPGESTGGDNVPKPGTAGPEIPPAITVESFLERQRRIRELLKESGASALLETPGGSLTWLTGLPLAPCERLVALLLPTKGTSLLLGRALERETLQSLAGTVGELRMWEEEEVPIHLLEKELKKRDLGNARIALGTTLRYEEMATLHSIFPKARFISAGPQMASLRQAKGGDEVALIRTAALIASRGIEEVASQIREGMGEDEIAFRLEAAMRAMGAGGSANVRSGPLTSLPLARTSGRKLVAGDVVLLEARAQVLGYFGAVARTLTLGKATGRMKLIHDTIRRAQEFALERAKAGVKCAVLDQAFRSTMGGRGLFPEIRHRLGAGIGVEPAEDPWLSIANTEPIPAGAVAAVGPGAYTPGEYGVLVRDVLEFTPTGGRWLTTPPASIQEIG